MGVNWFYNVLTQPALVCLRERRVGRVGENVGRDESQLMQKAGCIE